MTPAFDFFHGAMFFILLSMSVNYYSLCQHHIYAIKILNHYAYVKPNPSLSSPYYNFVVINSYQYWYWSLITLFAAALWGTSWYVRSIQPNHDFYHANLYISLVTAGVFLKGMTTDFLLREFSVWAKDIITNWAKQIEVYNGHLGNLNKIVENAEQQIKSGQLSPSQLVDETRRLNLSQQLIKETHIQLGEINYMINQLAERVNLGLLANSQRPPNDRTPPPSYGT